jgi:hypothetical protein
MTTTRFFFTLTEQSKPSKFFAIDIFSPLRQWLNHIEFSDRQFAEKICHLIPASCPFERDVSAFGYTYHIPPLQDQSPI